MILPAKKGHLKSTYFFNAPCTSMWKITSWPGSLVQVFTFSDSFRNWEKEQKVDKKFLYTKQR